MGELVGRTLFFLLLFFSSLVLYFVSFSLKCLLQALVFGVSECIALSIIHMSQHQQAWRVESFSFHFIFFFWHLVLSFLCST